MNLDKVIMPTEKEISEIVDKHFKDVGLYFHKGLDGRGLHIVMTLGKDKSEFINGIEHNDPLRNIASIYPLADDQLELKFPLHISWLKPKVSWLSQSNEKVRTRKVKGDKAKVLKAFDRNLGKLAARVKELNDAGEFLDGLPFEISSKLK